MASIAVVTRRFRLRVSENSTRSSRQAPITFLRAERGVAPGHERRVRVDRSGGGDRLLELAGGATPGAGLAAAQPRLGDHRRRGRSGQRGDQRGQPLAQQRAPGDLGVPERGALFLVPVDRAQQRVDVQKHPLVAAGQQRGARRERDQMRAGHCGELVGMPEGELAQKDPHCRGRVHLVEHPGRAAGAQQVRIIDAVRAAHHARDDRGQLPGRVDRPGPHPRGRQLHMLAD